MESLLCKNKIEMEYQYFTPKAKYQGYNDSIIQLSPKKTMKKTENDSIYENNSSF